MKVETTGIARGVVLAVAVCLLACSSSPQQKLAHMRSQLMSLQNSTIQDFLQTELKTIHASLQSIETLIEQGQVELADTQIDEAQKRLQHAQHLYTAREKVVKEYSQEFIAYVHFHLDSASTVIRNMPHKTFVDQNRRDIARFRLRAVQKQAAQLQDLFVSERFFKAYAEAPRVQTSLIELLRSVDLMPLDWEVFRTSVRKASPKMTTKPRTSLAKLQ